MITHAMAKTTAEISEMVSRRISSNPPGSAGPDNRLQSSAAVIDCSSAALTLTGSIGSDLPPNQVAYLLLCVPKDSLPLTP